MVSTYILIFFVIFFIALFVVYFRLKGSSGLSAGDTQSADSLTVLEVQISKNQEELSDFKVPSLSAENMFAAIHGLLKEDTNIQEHFSFEIVASSEHGIRFYVVVPQDVAKFIEGQIYAHFPKAQVKVTTDFSEKYFKNDSKFQIAELSQLKPYYYPIKSFRDFEADPLSSLTSSLAEIGEDEEIWMQFLLKPMPDIWQKEGYGFVQSVREGYGGSSKPNFFSNFTKIISNEALEITKGIATGLFTQNTHVPVDLTTSKDTLVRLTPTQEMEMQAIENKLTRMGYYAVVKVMSSAKEDYTLESNLRSVLAVLKQYTSTALNSFGYILDSNNKSKLENMRSRYFDSSKQMILNVEELATLYHFPSSNIDTPNISWIYSRKSEPPADLPTSDCVYIGETMYRNKKFKFGVANNDDRLRHMYVIGKSGTGKSTMFVNMICQDIYNGAGLAVLDPHGETIDKVMERLPDHRLKDIIYFDPSDTERPIGLNLLEMESPDQKNLMASGLVSAIHHHFDYSWGPRLEYLLNYAILTLLDVPGTTMMGITRILEDKNYQNYILHQVKDPVVHKFWDNEFKEMKGNQKLVTEAISPIQNKVNRFLASTTIRNILGQRNSTLDIWDAMNTGKILLINLSKGKIGADNVNLLGALLVSRLQFFALQRARIPYDQRKPFYMYVDEFQNFATGSFEEILSESRKYKLGLYLTHQFTAQLSEELLKAVLGNVGTIATFSLGAGDANVMSYEFSPHFTADDIISLEKFQVYIKLMVNGMTSVPFSARILLPWEEGYPLPITNNREKAIQMSREKYGVPREFVESKINKWVEFQFDKGTAIAQEYKNNQPQEDKGKEIN